MSKENISATINPEVLCPILEEVAKHYEKGTPQEKAIEIAAFALLFISMENHLSNFCKFVDTAGRNLTEDQKRHLQSMGLEIND